MGDIYTFGRYGEQMKDFDDAPAGYREAARRTGQNIGVIRSYFNAFPNHTVENFVAYCYSKIPAAR